MKQPKVLRYFFLTEVWERFGFYTIQTLLVLYMASALGFSDSKSYTIIGEFTALAYIMPLLGGYLADRVLGYRFSIVLGGILLCAGYALLGIFSKNILVGLSLVIMGNGLFKPNISSFLGQFYDENDPRRDSGYTLFYIGINIGGLVAPLLGGFIQQWFGWYTCFAVASIGLIIGVLTFKMSYPLLQNKGFSPRYPNITNLPKLLLSKPHISLGLIAIIAVIFTLMNFPTITTNLLDIVGVILIIGLIILAIKQHSLERKHMIVLIVMLLFSVIFWGLFFQMYFSVNLFTERAVNRTIGTFTIPTSAIIALESTFIVIFGPIFAFAWQHMNPKKRFMTTPFKFAYGILFIALAFELLAYVIQHANSGTPVNVAWMILFYALFVIAELFLSPIGLSMVTTLSPAKYVGLMMGVWFITLGYGGALSGFLAQEANVPEAIITLADQMQIYKHAFQHFANFGFIAFAVLFIMAPVLTKLMFCSSDSK